MRREKITLEVLETVERHGRSFSCGSISIRKGSCELPCLLLGFNSKPLDPKKREPPRTLRTPRKSIPGCNHHIGEQPVGRTLKIPQAASQTSGSRRCGNLTYAG